MKRVKDPDDPDRCRSVAACGGQCWNRAAETSDFCPVHGGAIRDGAYTEMSNYLTDQFINRMKIECGEVDEIKLLKENLMNLNAVIAAKTALMKDESSMLTHAGPVTDLIMKAEKVTASLHRLGTASGLLLAKPALISWGQQIIQAISEMIEDKYDGWEDDLHDFSDKVASIIIVTKNDEESK